MYLFIFSKGFEDARQFAEELDTWTTTDMQKRLSLQGKEIILVIVVSTDIKVHLWMVCRVNCPAPRQIVKDQPLLSL